ncbi:MAG: bifunctional adenosylcobinamide kinase/adenosylcobinamide-phosphate guanylyltransferase [Leptolyngbyaceae bacterium]|nr:bifunctional adenosylcobinamide kinase/adenosylcobinamide-phosphate guanylyltransferase [Leptolyngbyaceae bacterium]
MSGHQLRSLVYGVMNVGLPSTVLVTGPSRSGKSEWAERLAAQCEQAGQTVTYVATSIVDSQDLEWVARIERHQQRRPLSWKTLHVPTDVSAVIQGAGETDCLLVDSLGTWLANGLDWEDDEWNQTQQGLLAAIAHCRCTLIFVSEETGWGVVPAYPAGRRFRDRLGTLTRHIGAIANTTYLVTAGYVLNLSELGTHLDVPE